jgi:hypothetical protein
MRSHEAGFFIDGYGTRLTAAARALAWQFGMTDKGDPLADALCRGWVLIKAAHRTLFVELCPERVEPLAALEAVYQIRAARPACVVLSLVARSTRPQEVEVFRLLRPAIDRVSSIARSASLRDASRLEARARERRAKTRGHSDGPEAQPDAAMRPRRPNSRQRAA